MNTKLLVTQPKGSLVKNNPNQGSVSLDISVEVGVLLMYEVRYGGNQLTFCKDADNFTSRQRLYM